MFLHLRGWIINGNAFSSSDHVNKFTEYLIEPTREFRKRASVARTWMVLMAEKAMACILINSKIVVFCPIA